jgi:hypothetical protein
MMCEDLGLLQQDRWQSIYSSHKAEGQARLVAHLITVRCFILNFIVGPISGLMKFQFNLIYQLSHF